MSTRVTSSRLIGRTAELAELEAALVDAADGRPSVAFVAGDSGVGKSRLLAEFEQRAADGGALVLAGDCVDLGESELAYVPLVAALRPLARSGDPALTEPVRAAVAPLLPGLTVAAQEPAESDGEGGAQGRLFEGLLSLLDGLGARQPVLLLIEDLHWADRSTRAALAFLGRSLQAERVLIVGTYRPDEMHRRHPLRPLLAELERNPRALRIALAPLTHAELTDQLADILGAPPEPELLERLWSRSGGNPLYCEELLAAGLDGRGAAPDTLRDALMLRVERLSEPAQELLRLVAVAQRADDPLLAATSGLERQALRDGLRESVEGHILIAGDDDRYRFRHALLREVVEDDLLPGERSALHLALARGLEARIDESAGAVLTAAVAHHYASAGDQPAALAASVRAAAAAERVYAHGEASALLDRALELWERVPDPATVAGADHVDLLTRAGDAAWALGHPGRQLSLFEAAFAELGPDPDPWRAAWILESTARALRHLNRPQESIATLERALALVEAPAGDTTPGRARLLAGLARGRMLDGRFSDGVEIAQRALDAAVASDMRATEGHARNTLGFCLAMIGEVDPGAEQLREAIRIARERDHLPDLADAYNNYSDMLHVVGRTTEALEAVAEGLQAVEGAARLDDVAPVPACGVRVRHRRVGAVAGQPAGSEALDRDADACEPRPAPRLAGRRARRARGGARDPRRARRDGRRVERAPVHRADAVPTAEQHRREGDLDGARAAIERGLDRMEFYTDDAARVAAVAAAGVTVEADAAERARDLSEAEAESAAQQRLDDLLARVAAAATRTRPVECALLLESRAEAGRGAGRADPAAYERAAGAWDVLGRPEQAARMRLREAEAFVAAGDREAAARSLTAAHAVAVRLGAGWLRTRSKGSPPVAA